MINKVIRVDNSGIRFYTTNSGTSSLLSPRIEACAVVMRGAAVRSGPPERAAGPNIATKGSTSEAESIVEAVEKAYLNQLKTQQMDWWTQLQATHPQFILRTPGWLPSPAPSPISASPISETTYVASIYAAAASSLRSKSRSSTPPPQATSSSATTSDRATALEAVKMSLDIISNGYLDPNRIVVVRS